MTELEQWMAWRSQEDERLYERFGKLLEKEHTGEVVAIGPDGRTILGQDDNQVFQKAIEEFGSGNFGLFRVGYPALERWLSIAR